MSIKNLRILLIEDDKNASFTIKTMLHELGMYRVLVAADGKHGSEVISSASKIDLILCDWDLPYKSGIEILQDLRRINNLTPFIMITGKADPASVRMALKAGVSAYIKKPFKKQEIHEKIIQIHAKQNR